MEVQVLSPAHASPCPKRFAKRCGRVSRSTKKTGTDLSPVFFSSLHSTIPEIYAEASPERSTS